MISDLIDIASYIRTLYQRLEYLDSIDKKDSIEYKRAVEELKRERKKEEDIISFHAIHNNQINTLIQELRAKYPFLERGVAISAKDLVVEKQVAIRIMNELSTIDSTFLSKNGYNNH